MIREQIARTFNDINSIISSSAGSFKIPKSEKESNDKGIEKPKDVRPVIWFRGQRMASWSIIPSMYRDGLSDCNTDKTYGSYHLMEDYRFHSFRAKAGHHITTNPSCKLEWQEIMQHHMVKTRLLDWTESAISALIFALEPLMQPQNDLTTMEKRHVMAPVLWLLNPYKLNEHIYDLATAQIDGKYLLIERALESVASNKRGERERIAAYIGTELSQNKELYFNSKSSPSINGLINLSAIEATCQQHSNRLLQSLTNFQLNPFHYILLRYYVEGLVFDIGNEQVDAPSAILPPLATIHQYHSERIRAQRGVFLVVPHYNIAKGKAVDMYDSGIDLRAMELQKICTDCLVKIRIVNPTRIAQEMMFSGERRSSIYPELPTYAEDMEANEYYV